MAKKYILCPGYVYSKKDGERHYISAKRLARLYGVKMSDCYIMEYGHECYGIASPLPRLYPDYDGDYDLPKETERHDNVQ